MRRARQRSRGPRRPGRAVAAAPLQTSAARPVAAEADGPALLHKIRSAHHEIHVYERGNTRYLTFEPGDMAALQSLLDRGQPHQLSGGYRQGLLAATALHAAPRRVLCLGVGAGPVPLALRRAFPEAVVDAVDLDPEVIRVARDWFDFAPDERLRLHVADAREFLRRSCAEGRRWDVVLQDVFDRRYIPAHLMTVEYFRELAHVLEPEGVFAVNTFAQAHFHERELATYARVFAHCFEIATDGPNRVIVGWPQPMPAEPLVHARLQGHAGHLERAGVCAASLARCMRPTAHRAHDARPFTDEDCRHPELASLRQLAIEQAALAEQRLLPPCCAGSGRLSCQLRIFPPMPTTLIST